MAEFSVDIDIGVGQSAFCSLYNKSGNILSNKVLKAEPFFIMFIISAAQRQAVVILGQNTVYASYN